MNAIIALSEVLEDQTFGKLNETQAEYVGIVLNSGRHLLQLIDDILDLAKVESGKLELHLSEVIVRPTIGRQPGHDQGEGFEARPQT